VRDGIRTSLDGTITVIVAEWTSDPEVPVTVIA
jgi:hypothetical protein